MIPENEPLMLTLPGDLSTLPIARNFVSSVCQAAGLDRSTTDAVVLAANEAVGNVIRHAHRDRPGTPFQIHCYVRSDSIEIQLLDEGDPFDLAAVPQLDPAELRLGGRGVFLMRRVMDEISCESRGLGRGNLLRMVKRYRRDSPPPVEI